MKEKNRKVQLKLTDGERSYSFEGKLVIAIISEPEGQDADTAMLALGGGSPFQAAVSAGSGIASFIEKASKTNLERLALTVAVMGKLMEAITEESKEKTLFEGTLDEFLNGKKEG